jgi:guanylate kinase
VRAACIIGESGAGKTSIVSYLVEHYPDLYQEPVSATTRSARSGEVDGEHYHFLDRAGFERLICEGQLAEHATYNGNLYGIPLASLADIEQRGRIALPVVEDEGALSLRSRINALVVAIVAPSQAERLRRLGDRGDGSQAVAERVEADRHRDARIREIADIVIVNERVEEAAEQLHRLLAERA